MNGPKALIRYLQLASIGLMFLQSPLMAQDRLPSEVYQADPLNEAQVQSIDLFLETHIQSLLSDDAELRQSARRSLSNPLRRPNATQAFQTTYAEQAVQALTQPLQSSDFAIRLNALIILSDLSIPEAVELASEYINDDNPAVRYWAVRCFQNRELISQLDPQQATAFLDILSKRLAVETSDPACIRLAEALDAYDNPQAYTKLLDALYLRHDNQVRRDSLACEARGLTLTFRWMIRSQSAGMEIAPYLTETAALAHVNAKRALAQLQENPGRESAAELIRVVDQIFDLTETTFFPNTPVPGQLQRHLIREDWTALQSELNTWGQLLLDPTIDLPERARAIIQP